MISKESVIATDYWHRLDDGRVQCDLCPRFCKLHEGQQGLCFVRANRDDQIVFTSYGRSSGFCIDPIEKKPLNHFLPGSSVFSFGTAGCNLACKYCQNWDMSKSREFDTLAHEASPTTIARIAQEKKCRSVAFTYNDPVIFLEYAKDVAHACRARGIKTVAVTAGYICDQPRIDFFNFIDAANIDLKAFTERFYWKITGGHLQKILETLLYVKHETNVCLELTTLLIPGENDSSSELESMTQWVVEYLGPDVPLHFTAFHPDWKMQNIANTPLQTLIRARAIALKNGIRYVYTGNVYDKPSQSTYCYHCGEILVGRDCYVLSDWNIDGHGQCKKCGTSCAGLFEDKPGQWGAKREVVKIQAMNEI